jgi:hypothetical protein
VSREIIRVGHAVSANIRTGRIPGIGPPVVSLGKIIVRPARAPRTRESGDGYGQLVKVAFRRDKNALPVDFCEVRNNGPGLLAECEPRHAERGRCEGRRNAEFSARPGIPSFPWNGRGGPRFHHVKQLFPILKITAPSYCRLWPFSAWNLQTEAGSLRCRSSSNSRTNLQQITRRGNLRTKRGFVVEDVQGADSFRVKTPLESMGRVFSLSKVAESSRWPPAE